MCPLATGQATPVMTADAPWDPMKATTARAVTTTSVTIAAAIVRSATPQFALAVRKCVPAVVSLFAADVRWYVKNVKKHFVKIA